MVSAVIANPGPEGRDSTATTMTTGASFRPDSASKMPTNRRGSCSGRRVAKTAAASVEDTTATRITAVRQGTVSRRCAATAVTAMLTATPTVASACLLYTSDAADEEDSVD